MNFARHVTRNHPHDAEAQKILALPPKKTERIDLLAVLRKRGNYLNSNSVRNLVKKPILLQKKMHLLQEDFKMGKML